MQSPLKGFHTRGVRPAVVFAISSGLLGIVAVSMMAGADRTELVPMYILNDFEPWKVGGKKSLLIEIRYGIAKDS